MRTCYVRLKGFPQVIEAEVDFDVRSGDLVVCELEKGPCLGEVISNPKEKERDHLPKVLRKANEDDISSYSLYKERISYALEFCEKKIRELGLPMKLLWAEYTLGGTKLIFYFYSETRVDFRELVRELAREFKVRIELRQVGVRDQAKIVGGLGSCGDVICCKRFLNSFSSVSIKMVKEQGLALNPTKISGICGRLLCCLSYEYDMYLDYKRELPRVGDKVEYQGEEAKVVKQNPLLRQITIELMDGRELNVPVERIKRREGR